MTRKGTPCKNPVKSRSRCHLHGPENKKTRKGQTAVNKAGSAKPGNGTHSIESILCASLPEEDRALWHGVITHTPDAIDEELRLITVREARILRGIEEIKSPEFTVVERVVKNGSAGSGADQEKHKAALFQVRDLESDLTRIQAHKVRLLQLKFGLEAKDMGGGADAVARSIQKAQREMDESYEDPADSEMDQV